MKRSPFLIAIAAGALSLVVAFVPTLWHMLATPAAPPGSAPPADTPWRVSLPAPGQSRVFGLDLPSSTLAAARDRWGEDLQVAVMAGRDAAPVLEAYLEKFEAGGVQGRLMLVFDADPAALARWREAAPGTPTESGARRHVLAAPALAEARSAALSGLTFIPAAQLDAAILTARFGEPAQRIVESDRLEHWLYPALGLAVALDTKGRDVLQYVAPADFEQRLAAPLRGLPAGAPTGAR